MLYNFFQDIKKSIKPFLEYIFYRVYHKMVICTWVTELYKSKKYQELTELAISKCSELKKHPVLG